MLDEVVMSVGQPAEPPPSLARSLVVVVVMKGWGGVRGTLKAPVGACVSFCPPKLMVDDF